MGLPPLGPALWVLSARFCMSVSDGGDSFISFLAVAAAWQRLIQSGQSVSIGKGGACPTWWDALFEGPVDSPHTESETEGNRGVSAAAPTG
jgi:hypothetical protein